MKGTWIRRGLAVIAGTAIAAGSGSLTQAGQIPVGTTPDAPQQAASDIVDTAVAAADFTTLVAAVQAAGLVETLKGEGPFTVFAPTDAAFAALPDGTVDALLADTDALTEVLLYHVVPGRVLAADVVGLTSATTAGGDDLAISVSGSTVMLNDGATVVATDVEASNGVIHVIDSVLLPPGFTPPAAAQQAAPTPTPAAAQAATPAATAVPGAPQSGTGGYLEGGSGIAAWIVLLGASVALLGGSGVLLASQRRR